MVSKSMVEYVTCMQVCKKKCDGDKTGDLVFCNTCDGEILKKRCIPMQELDFVIEEENLDNITDFDALSELSEFMKAAVMQV